MNPKHPVYVITKGRWDSNLTANALDRMKVPYNLVVEPQEYEYYALAVNPDKILTLPFSNLERGSIPARNWVWEHSMSTGASKHWILDDNIEAFNRLNRNMKLEVDTGSIFRAAEDFVDRYENIAISGFNYYSFCKATDCLPPYYLNTRVYSCLLIKNDIDFRWRGRYNEDTDLCLRVLKAGYCTVLFNAFLAGKVTTMRMKGGNTDELYADDGRKKMAEAIVDLHPDVARVTKKFGRWHHQIDYRPFRKNRLIKKKDLNIPNKVNNYGMVIKKMEKTK
tara:strand:+ start:603 stop:1439 length:837 start_codon:yes stop_codon:yes gene_type:complete